MSITLVAAKHAPGPHINGHDRCHARAGHDGMCPGVDLAKWLNSIGPDDKTYLVEGDRVITCGMVRDNWLRGNDHIIAVEPELARLRASERRAQAELRSIRGQIKRYENAFAHAVDTARGAQ